MQLIKEFKEFAVKGNMIDLAVGLIIGAAFGLVVKSIVDDLLMPPLGFLIGGVDFSTLSITLAHGVKAGDVHPITQQVAGKDIAQVVIAYGKFINVMIAFVIQAFAVFMVVKGINTLRRRPDPVPEVPDAPPEDVKLLTEIRDLLQTRQS